MTPNFQRIKDAISKNCLDSMGNVYTVTVDDVVDYIEKELSPAMKAQLATIDEESFAFELADAIGNVGIMELIETAICETIKTQIAIAREVVLEAQSESEFIEALI